MKNNSQIKKGFNINSKLEEMEGRELHDYRLCKLKNNYSNVINVLWFALLLNNTNLDLRSHVIFFSK